MDNEKIIYGYCRCCGQMITLDADYGSQDENNWEATGRCNCPGSRDSYFSFRRRQTQIRDANQHIDNLLVDSSPDTNLNAVDPDAAEQAVAILRAAVVPVVDRLLYKVSISISGGVKASIGRSGKDNVAVERADAVKQKLES